MELNEDELNEVFAGPYSYETAKEKQSDFFNRTAPKNDELSEEYLQGITAGAPVVSGELEDGTYINEFGEVVREGNMRR